MSRLQSALLVCCVMALATRVDSAHAQGTPTAAPSEEAKAEASAHFKQGADLFRDGFYRAALVELKRAYEIAPNYRVLYNIGTTHVSLGEFLEAVRAFEDYLAQGGAGVPAARRTELEAELPQLRRHIAALTIRVNREGAVVLVDEKEVGKAPLAQSVATSVGHHRVSARAEDGETASVEVDVAGGDNKEVVLQLATARVDQPVAQSAGPGTPPEPRFTKRQRWTIGVLSSAGALAVAGGALALVAKSARDDYRDKLDTTPGNAGAIDGARDRLWRTSLSADVLWGGAVLAGASGLVLFFLKDRDADEAPKEKPLAFDVRVGPQSIVAEGRF